MTRDAQVSRHRRSRLPGLSSGGGSRRVLALPCFCPIRGGLILGGCTPVPSSVPATSPLPSRFGADARVYNFPACWFLSNGCSWFCVFVASGSGLGPAAPLACLPRQARLGLGWTKQERVPCCRGRGRQALHEELRVCRPKSSPRTEAGMGGVWGSGVVSGVPREGLPEERWFVKVLRRRAAGWGVAQLRRPVQRPRGATLTPCPGAASWKQLLPGGTHRTGTFPAGSGVGEFRGWLEAAAFDAGVSGEHLAW